MYYSYVQHLLADLESDVSDKHEIMMVSGR
jgi:hypothetical protein